MSAVGISGLPAGEDVNVLAGHQRALFHHGQRVGWNRCACALDPGVVCEECGLPVEGHHWHLVPSRRLRLYVDYPTGLLYHEVCGRQRQADNERRKIESALEDTLPLGEEDQTETFLYLAREGNEEEFKELAQCLGVAKEHINMMWIGTRRRVGHCDE